MTGPLLSRRARSLKPSATLAIAAKAKAMIDQGVNVVGFSLGEPDFDTPKAIREAAIEALNTGHTHYMPTLGDTATRAAVADKLWRENNIAGLTPQHVAISVGVKHVLYNLCQVLLDAPASGEAPLEAILPVPAWLSYGPITELAGGKVIEARTRADQGFKLTPELFRSLVTPRTRIVLLNSPSNPCGTVYSEAELRALASAIAEAARTIAPHLVIITDEIYEKIIYGPHGHFAIGSLPEVAHRTVTVNGMSKAYAMTGWRIGYCVCPGDFGKSLIQAIDRLQGQMTNNITSFTYAAVRTALSGVCDSEVAVMREAFASRARRIYALSQQVPGMKAFMPDGAFYLFPGISAWLGKKTSKGTLLVSSRHIAEALLDEAHVAVVPGEEFGGEGERHIRLSFACRESLIDEGMMRIKAFAEGLMPA
jgi:aspartate aminotransferase